MSDFPNSAQAVIIGGGIVGCSTAYHLAKLGWEVVLVERFEQVLTGNLPEVAPLCSGGLNEVS